jgi:uncharacterized protein with HEPN domain
MTQKAGRDRLRLVAMVQAAEDAMRDAPGTKEAFLRPGLNQKAVLLDLIHLTESAEKTSPGFKRANPTIAWARLSRMRNEGLVHDYLTVDLDELWRFLRSDLPRLRRQLDRVRYPSEGPD